MYKKLKKKKKKKKKRKKRKKKMIGPRLSFFVRVMN